MNLIHSIFNAKDAWPLYFYSNIQNKKKLQNEPFLHSPQKSTKRRTSLI